MTVRYLLQALPSGDFLSWDLPLEDVEVSVGLSTPTVVGATITHERAEIAKYLRPFGAAIFVDDGSGDLHGGILTDVEADGPKIRLTIAGYSYYPTNQPWLSKDFNGVQVDPLDMVRKIWDHLQGYPSGDLNLEVDKTKSPIRIGHEEQEVNFTDASGNEVSFDAGPYRLNWFSTSDLGKEFSDLITEAKASYLEKHWWDGDTIRHRLQIDYPARAVRRSDLRFVLGENVVVSPRLALPNTSYASHVLLIGAGEGREAAHADIPAQSKRLRRAVVVADKSVKTNKKALELARAHLTRRGGDREELSEITVLDHPNADFRTITPGDIIRVSGDTDWIDLDTEALVMSKSFDPSNPTTGVLELDVL